MIVLKLYALVTGVKTLIADLSDYSSKAINEALFGTDGTKFLENQQLLKGNTLIYAHNNDMAKAHLLKVSEAISGASIPFGFTSTQSEVDNTLDVPVTTKRGEYIDKLKIILPHCSDTVIESINDQADKIKTAIGALNDRIASLQPTLLKADYPSLTLYWKDSTVDKLQTAVEKHKKALEALKAMVENKPETKTETKNE